MDLKLHLWTKIKPFSDSAQTVSKSSCTFSVFSPSKCHGLIHKPRMFRIRLIEPLSKKKKKLIEPKMGHCFEKAALNIVFSKSLCDFIFFYFLLLAKQGPINWGRKDQSKTLETIIIYKDDIFPGKFIN